MDLVRGVIGVESTPEDAKSPPLCAVLRQKNLAVFGDSSDVSWPSGQQVH